MTQNLDDEDFRIVKYVNLKIEVNKNGIVRCPWSKEIIPLKLYYNRRVVKKLEEHMKGKLFYGACVNGNVFMLH